METDLLANLIDQKHEVLSQLGELSRRQLALAAAEGDMTPLLSVLGVKQQLLGRLTTIERQLDAFREQEPESRLWRSAADRTRCARAAEQCRTLLAELTSLEKQGLNDLLGRRDAAAARLKAAGAATQAREAYAGAAAPRASHLDLTSET